LGRFISEDTLGFPSGLNRCVRANNPLTATDPSGTDWLDNTSTFAAGWGDAFTMGGTRWIRKLLGVDGVVDDRSGYYFSPLDQITSIVQGGLTSSFVYDALGRMTNRSPPNGVSTDWAFDAPGFLSSVISKRAGLTFDSHVYGRDPVGNILQENRNGTLDTFSYDDLYAITSANVNGLQYTWRYDGLGNRLREDKGFQQTDYYYDAANCAVTIGGRTVTHDPNGNVTAYGGDTYTWDVRGRLVKLVRTGLTVEFTYDPFGNRTGKKVNGTLTKYLLDGEDVVSEITGSTTVNVLQSPTLDEPLLRNGRYFTPKHLGSTTTLTDGAGTVVQSYLYGPFGDVTASTGEANPIQYAGRENDGTGLYYNRKRYYVPEWGRFLSEDPIGLAGGLNQYVYASNNPLNASDPSGTIDFQAPFRWLWKLIIRVFGVRVAPGTATLQNPDPATELLDEPLIRLERGRFRSAGSAVSDYLDDVGTAIVAELVLGAGPRIAHLSQERLEHIAFRHWPTAGAGAAGRFLPSTSLRQVIQMIDDTLRNGTIGPNPARRGGLLYEYDFGYQIGVSRTGGPATRLQVVTDAAGNIVSAWPL
jgi:RHS repeat-associated protein